MSTDTPTTQIPVAVYGTLRVGYRNHRLLAGRTASIASGVVDGYELVVDGLPFARPSTTGRLVVEVMWLLPDIYDRVLADLDRLEGFDPDAHDNLYTRVEASVTTTDGHDVQAWLYVAGERATRHLKTYVTAVPSGDYADVSRPTETPVTA